MYYITCILIRCDYKLSAPYITDGKTGATKQYTSLLHFQTDLSWYITSYTSTYYNVSSVVKTIFPLEFMVIRQYQISTTIPGKLFEKQGHSNLTIIHA